MNKHLRIVIALLISLCSIGSSFVTTAAQESWPDPGSSTFVTQMGGVTIDIGNTGDAVFDDWNYWEPTEEPGPNGPAVREDIGIRLGNSVIIFTLVEGSASPEHWNSRSIEYLPSFSNEVQILGQGADEEVGWLLTLGLEKLDIEVAAYSEFRSNAIGNTHAAYVIYEDAADMTETIFWVQSELTFDGETIFDGADLTEIQAMLDGTSATMPVQVQMNEYTVDDWADMGLESEEEWIVPPLDHSVTWEPEYFQFPFHKEFAIQQFDEGDAAIQLQAPGFSGWAYVNIGPNVDDRTIQDWGDH